MTQLKDAPTSTNVPSAMDSPAQRLSSWQLLCRSRVNKICIGVILGYVIVGIVSLLPAPRHVWGLNKIPGIRSIYSFDDLINFKYNTEQDYAPPAWTYTNQTGTHFSPAAWFGLDIFGRSIFWRLLYGARTALLITILSSLLVMIIGAALGIIAGYYGGAVDDLITWVYAVVGTVPWLLLVIAVSYVLQENAELDDSLTPSPWAILRWFHEVLPTDLIIIILALGLTDWIGLCRLVRGEVIKLRDSDMVAAGRALGLSEPRILFRHILPNVSHLIIISFTLGAVGYLQVEVVLAFLGIICMALTLLGDSLRDALDPKLRGRD
jgi:ABC-type dipeptide/oligopeptide/nickel transport system permease subunit